MSFWCWNRLPPKILNTETVLILLAQPKAQILRNGDGFGFFNFGLSILDTLDLIFRKC